MTDSSRSEEVAASKQKYAFDTKSSFLQLFQGWPKHFDFECANSIYRKVANSSLSWLLARFQIFRRLMKGKFDAYIL